MEISAPLKTNPCLRRFNSFRNALSGITQRLRPSSTTLSGSGIADAAISTVEGWIQASPAGVSVILSTVVPADVPRTEMISLKSLGGPTLMNVCRAIRNRSGAEETVGPSLANAVYPQRSTPSQIPERLIAGL